MAAGSRPRRVMILFRPVLGIYAIGDSDKPRRRDIKKNKVAAEVRARGTSCLVSRYALNGQERRDKRVRKREGKRGRDI